MLACRGADKSGDSAAAGWRRAGQDRSLKLLDLLRL